jgi:methionyl aminopeptidase
MTVEDADDLVGLARCGRVVAEARDAMVAAAGAGVSTLDLDHIGRDLLRAHGARSAPRQAYGFPGWTCISVNDEVAHGVPAADRRLADGDVVNVDVSAELDGYWTDTGASVTVGRTPERTAKLVASTRRAQQEAMSAARVGRPLRHIGRAVQRRAALDGFSVIRNLCGHGVGRFIHEDPTVPGIELRRDRTTLWEGLVLAIEPFLSTGATLAVEGGDGWTLRTDDGGVAAQFEHTVVVRRGEPLVLTA